MTEMTGLVSKLTVKALGLKPAEIIKAMTIGEAKVIGRMFGQATRYKVSESQFKNDGGLPREEVSFFGSFEGVNLETGETVNANKAYLPNEAASNALRAALDTAEGAVEFGLEIAIQKVVKKDGTEGYQFAVAVPKQPNAADPLAAIRDRMSQLPTQVATPALPAPETEGKKSKKAE